MDVIATLKKTREIMNKYGIKPKIWSKFYY